MKISFSIASAWWDGHQDQALAMLNGDDVTLDLKTEKAFSYGQGVHKALEMESLTTHRLPAIFKLPEFEVIATEQKLYKPMPSGDVLSGVIDVVAKHPTNGMIVLGDYKSGVNYKEMQGYVYHYLVKDHPWWIEHLDNADPTHVFFLTMNKHLNEAYVNISHLSMPKTQEEWDLPDATTYTTGYNWIMTIIDDIKNNLGIE
jgi:hypothetical protein